MGQQALDKVEQLLSIEPDILCLAKAITGGYAPLGATITTEKVTRSVGDEFSFYSTYGWHPFSVDAAIANIRYLMKHKTRLWRTRTG
jgi:acetylornithine/N-succinyldiaminopimelate aminotransferase